jgi:predicted dehydrogenase
VQGTYTVGLVGHGWRPQLFVDVVRRVPDRLSLIGAVVRRSESVEEVQRRWCVPVFLAPEDLVRNAGPDFIIAAVPRSVTPELVANLVDCGAFVLTETPPAADTVALVWLWDRVGSSQRVQVSEQYPLYPGHVARLELVRRGVIGQAT